MNQSREAHHAARPLHSPEGGQPNGCRPGRCRASQGSYALVASGSRRAADGAGRDLQTCRQTVLDPDHRFRPVRAAYLAFLTKVHGPQHLGTSVRYSPCRSRTEEVRVQIPSSPPQHPQVRASPSHHRRRSRRSRGWLGPHWGHGQPARAAEQRSPQGSAGRRRRARPGGRGARCRPPGTGGRSGGIWPDGAGVPHLQPQAPHHQPNPTPEPAEAGSLD
jgi:hypothetical protein